MICINDMAARQHAHEEGKAEELEQFINDKVAQLTEKDGEFYPFSPEHFSHALGEMPESLIDLFSTYAGEDLSCCIGIVITAHVRAFWFAKARLYVDRMIENKGKDYE